MHSIVELFDAVKTAQSIKSDYRLAQLLGVTDSAINAVRKRNGSVSDATALKIAELAGLPDDYVVACAHAHRATDQERPVWERIAKKAAGAAVMMLIGMGAMHSPDSSAAGVRAVPVLFIHYAKWIAAQMRQWAAGIARWRAPARALMS